MGEASKAPVPETMEGLRRQNSAYRALCASLEASQAVLTAKGREYHEAVTTLDSEREANRLLTDEVDALRKALKPFANAIGISFTCDEGDTLMVLRYLVGEPTGACLNSLQHAKDALSRARLSGAGQ